MSIEKRNLSRRAAHFERLKREVSTRVERLSALAFPATSQEKRSVTLAVNGLRRRLRELDALLEEVRK